MSIPVAALRATSWSVIAMAAFSCLVGGVAHAGTPVFGPHAISAAHEVQTSTFSVPASDFCSGKATFMLRVQNGNGAGQNPVSAAAISLNGVELFSEADFNAQVSTLTVPVALLPDNTLSAVVRGGSKGTLTVTILREVYEPVYGATTFTLTKEQQTFLDTVDGPVDGGAYVLTMRTGNEVGLNRVKSGVLLIDGEEVGRVDHRAASLAKTVSLRSGSRIELRAKGAPGNEVVVMLGREVDGSGCSLAIAIGSPAEGAEVAAMPLLVDGTAIGGPGIGIVVNGTPAAIDLNHAGTADDPFSWIAAVTTFGENGTVEAILRDHTGSQVSASRNVVVSVVTPSLIVRATPAIGVAPFPASFLVLPNVILPNTRRFNVDFDGDGVDEITNAVELPEPLVFTYPEPGLYRMSVGVAGDPAPRVETAVAVHSAAAVDGIIQQRWDDLRAALERQDVEAAVAAFTDASKSRYRAVFMSLFDRLPAIAAAMPSSLAILSIGGELADYLVTRQVDGTTTGHTVSLMRDADGVWKFAEL